MKNILFFAVLLVVFSCGNSTQKNENDGSDSLRSSDKIKQSDSSELRPNVSGPGTIDPMLSAYSMVIDSLKAGNFQGLISFIHPEKGLRFSPTTNVKKSDLLFTREQFLELVKDKTVKKVWGTYDGSGDPIKLTFSDYYKKFIFDKDFSKPDTMSVDNFIGGGNTVNNVKEFYTGARTADFHFKGTAKNNYMDWSTLRLVVEMKDGKLFLVGIVHDQWSI
jgi:hypothetical protein